MTATALLDLDLAEQVGHEAAIVYERIRYRCEKRGPYRASYAELMADLRMSERKVKSALRKLRDMGLLTCNRTSTSDAAYTWSTGVRNVPRGGDETSLSSYETEEITTNTSEPVVDEPQVIASITSLDGGLFPAEPVTREPTPAEMANQCRQSWLEAYTIAHGRPHPVTRDRAFGQIRTMVKACEQPDDFREVWRAARSAGEAGEWAVMNRLGPAPQSRRALMVHPITAMVQASYAAGEYDHLIQQPRDLGQ